MEEKTNNIPEFRVVPNGPMHVKGPITLINAKGEKEECEETWLCRCGNSKNKPFCDGSHKTSGFRS